MDPHRERKRIPIEDFVNDDRDKQMVRLADHMNVISNEVYDIRDDMNNLPCSNPRVGAHPEKCPSGVHLRNEAAKANTRYLGFIIRHHPFASTGIGVIILAILTYVSQNGISGT